MSKALVSSLLIGAGLIISAAVAILYASGISAVVGLPMLSVGAVIVLVILLCAMAVIFASFGLQDTSQALALPEGSIRAVIALMLIVLFAILSIYLYGSLATGQLTQLGSMSEEARATLVKTFGERNVVAVGNGRNFDVWLRQTATQDGVDFAKQLLVLVGTLVTSISSFYFGSKVASQSSERVSAAVTPAQIDSLKPDVYPHGTGPQDFVIEGSGLDRITDVKLALNGKRISATITDRTAKTLKFKVDLLGSQPNDKWSMILVDSKLGEQTITQSLIVT